MNCSSRLAPGAAEFLAAVLAASADVVVVADEDGTIGAANPAAEWLLGRTTRRSLLDLVHPDDRDVILEVLAAAELGLDALPPFPEPIRARDIEGRWVALEAVGVEPIRQAGAVWIVLVLRDVSAPDEHEHRLDHTCARLDIAAADGITSRVVFDVDRHDSPARRRLVADVGRGLAAGEFELYYQPIRDVRSGRIAGFEGLLRWNHPARGVLAAADFLPAVEGTSMIVDIGDFVLVQGCRRLARWQRRFGPAAAMLALNISARQLRQGDFSRRVADEVEAAGVDPRGLCFELTETHAIDREHHAVAELQALREMGAAVALDDFGTGYSSLHHLQEIGADVLKIERAFISKLGTDEGATAIVRAAIELGGAFGMITVAEGVTTIEQHRQLLALGCDRIQGFLIAPAVPPELAEAMLGAEPADDPTVGVVDAEKHLTVLRAYDALTDIDVEYRPSEEEVAAIAGVTALHARRGMTFRPRRDIDLTASNSGRFQEICT